MTAKEWLGQHNEAFDSDEKLLTTFVSGMMVIDLLKGYEAYLQEKFYLENEPDMAAISLAEPD